MWASASSGLAIAVLSLGALTMCSPEPGFSKGQVQVALQPSFDLGAELFVAKRDVVARATEWNAYAEPVWNGSAYLVALNGTAWLLDASARQLNAAPVRLPTDTVGGVGSNGTDWLIAWGTSAGIRAIRVSATGALLDASGFQIATTPVSDRIGIASNGTDYLVTWTADPASTNGGQVQAARVRANGTVVDATPILVATGPRWCCADATWAGTHYLVAWGGGEDIYGVGGDVRAARVTSAGTVLDSQSIAVSIDPARDRRLHVASSGNESLVVWDRVTNMTTGGTSIMGARISSTGAVMDVPAIQIADSSTIRYQPDVTWDGSDYVTYYPLTPCNGSGNGTGARRVARAGVVGPEQILACSAASNGPDMWRAAGESGNHLQLMRDPAPGRYFAVARAVASDGRLLGTWEPVSARSQRSPQIAARGNQALVVWREGGFAATNPSEQGWAAAARLDRSANTLDPDRLTFVSSSGSRSASIVDQSVAAHGNGFFVSLNDNPTGLEVAVVTSAGEVSQGVRPSPSNVTFLLSNALSDGTGNLATWIELAGSTTTGSYARRYDANGVAIDSAPIALPQGLKSRAGVWNGSSYLIVSVEPAIRGYRLTRTGEVIDGPVTIGDSYCSSPPRDGQAADVAWDGTNHLVVWQGTNGMIRGARVDATNSVLDPGGFEITSGTCPRVAYNGKNYVIVWADVVWTDARSSTSIVRAVRLTPNATLLDPTPITVQSPGYAPDIASFGDGRALIVYQRPDPSDIRNADRVAVKVLSDVCDCDGGACEGGLCPGNALDAGSEGAAQDSTDGRPASDDSAPDNSSSDGSAGGAGASAGGSAGNGTSGASGSAAGGSAATSAGDGSVSQTDSGLDAAAGTSGKPKPPPRDDDGCSIGPQAQHAQLWELLCCIGFAISLTQSRCKRRKSKLPAQKDALYGCQ
jgi:hypothetical protein